ncbi:MAG: phytanoyl-CoA dioxygenase family protein [Chloroflexota bacterium]|nr:phytanoyl-CoA dioxygenase family protein [Chloroflexota bacterium]MDE2920853.1 phytanoyl-CoA dioxygenase family protein [Chloroflexota bacterium]
MKIDPEQFLDDGFVILKHVIPPERLDELRASFETLVDRQQAIWARDPEDPRSHAYKVKQPRLAFQTVVDAATANTVEFCLHDNTLGVSRQALRGAEAAPIAMFLMCNPATHYGPDLWHRDIQPRNQAPLAGLQADLVANGPGYVQWNIPLYDDDVLWVVPGSHRRLNTAQENRELLNDRRAPLSSGMPVKLKAGDGVMYINTILHWPSNYSTKLRRVIHLGYRSFGGGLYPYARSFYWEPSFVTQLSADARATFERFTELAERENDRIEAFLRAMLDQDPDGFREALAALHPGETGRMVCVVLLSKLAARIGTLKRPAVASLPDPERAQAVGEVSWGSFSIFEELAGRFTLAEAELLGQRIAPLNARLHAQTEQFVPGFQSGPTPHVFEDMPAGFGVDEFIASWSKAG